MTTPIPNPSFQGEVHSGNSTVHKWTGIAKLLAADR